METAKLKKFAQYARTLLIDQVSAKLEVVLSPGSDASRVSPSAIGSLKETIANTSKEMTIEHVAYVWFNRFCALRYMDLNRCTPVGVVSPAAGQFQPEILAEAKMGHIDPELVKVTTKNKLGADLKSEVVALINGQTTSPDPQGEAYRILVAAVCNSWHRSMPFLFGKVDDYEALLMPDDLLSGSSILAYTREALTPEVCQNVEVIGWLYQFYISEKKDAVFADLKKNKKISPANIPAATQLFTPNWIVRYLVENSLGRLWMLNNPNSRLAQIMDYYIKPDTTESDYLKVASVEDIKICDPACGSGHMLVYAFDLLYAIYEEEGYETNQIPHKILSQNLFGIEIDERAAELASFALMMKAFEKNKRYFRNPGQPNICLLQSIKFEDGEIDHCMQFFGKNHFSPEVINTLNQFEESDNFGSLIRPEFQGAEALLAKFSLKDTNPEMYGPSYRKVLQALKQASYLSPKYHVVVANPPYMGSKGMNTRLGAWAKENYPESKSDLYSMFCERILSLSIPEGLIGLMTPFTWMFLSTFEKLRSHFLNQSCLTSLVRPEYHAFFESAFVPVCAFTLTNLTRSEFRGVYIDLQKFTGAENQGPKTLEAIKNPNCGWVYRASASDFRKIPGSPIAYEASGRVREIFDTFPPLSFSAPTKQGLATGCNDIFLRRWSEVSFNRIGLGIESRKRALSSSKRWFFCNKGGAFRKWYGNTEFLVNWENDGFSIKNFYDENGKQRSRPQNQDFYFKEGLTWSAISSSALSMRYSPPGNTFETKGAMCFPTNQLLLKSVLGFANSKAVNQFLKATSPTLDFHEGPVGKLPFLHIDAIVEVVNEAINISTKDWNRFEGSSDFLTSPLIQQGNFESPISKIFSELVKEFRTTTGCLQEIEYRNNHEVIKAYGLQAELTPEVPLSEITLTCNPHYRYGGNKSDEELEALLLADTIKEFMSYAVGCMFGRYSLDKPGLILATQGDTLEEYLKQIPNPTFAPDKDNVIPILDGDWFTDDVTERFRKFLRVTFGAAHYSENLEFIESAIGKDIRKYFTKDFYADHVKRYKKRPIYWLFASPKGTFSALIYMHRYRKDTASIVLNEYLREFGIKLKNHKAQLEKKGVSEEVSQSDKTRALKEIETLKKDLAELDQWERDVMYPLATRQIEIDLDDGVKVNYAKFGAALKKIPGLDDTDE
jgi:type II restriction/modification system DNA methylase subunit YeeA